LKVTLFILTKIFLITPPETVKIQILNLLGEWLIGVGWVMRSLL